MNRILPALLLLLSSTTAQADVILLGDSIVADVNEPLFGWGEVLPSYLTSLDIKNRASSGASSRSYYQGYWTTPGWPYSDPVKEMVVAGDYVLLQFGHNDLPTGPPQAAVGDLEEYKSWLTLLVTEAHEVGSLPVFVTPPEGWAHRKQGEIGHIVQRSGHANAMKEVADRTKTPFIDLHAYSVEQFSIRTEEEAVAEFEPVDPETDLPIGDKTHTSLTGAEIWARFVAQEFPQAASLHFADAPGDYNLDGETNLTDFLILARHFNEPFPTPNSFRSGDSNVDGIVDLKDFFVFRLEYEKASGTADAAASVPEPSGLWTASFALILSVGWFLHRRERPV